MLLWRPVERLATYTRRAEAKLQKLQQLKLWTGARCYARDCGGSSTRCTFHRVPGPATEQLSDLLTEFGALSVSVEQHHEPGVRPEDIFADNLNQRNTRWGSCCVTAIFDAQSDVPSAVQLVQARLQQDYQHHVEPVPDRDWLQAIEDSYVPIHVADTLWIIPTSHQVQDDTACNIIMQPGLAFGTGEHPTTQLCLRHLAGTCVRDMSVLDYGTGSGILAIAALKMGAASAMAVDMEQQAVDAAVTNASLNHVGHNFQALTVDAAADVQTLQHMFAGQQYDVCLANILQAPLIALAPLLGPLVRPSGVLLLSGILTTQCGAVREAYQPFFSVFEERSDGEWALLVGCHDAAWLQGKQV